ncbi:MAG: amino acid adenylation domain-containing protein [Nannocystaceae bacterium]
MDPAGSDTFAALHQRLHRSFDVHGSRPAIVEPGSGTTLTYAELGDLVQRVGDALVAAGVAPGDRVGLCLPKSIDAIAIAIGAMMVGAVYVPVDASAPMARGAYILEDCEVKLVFCLAKAQQELVSAFKEHRPTVVPLADVGSGRGLEEALAAMPATPTTPVPRAAEDLAYILYTSGSTGTPKGVMLSHENACSFIDWASRLTQPTTADRFSSHAPLHFDLSILDLYTCLFVGATLVLVAPSISRAPRVLAKWIAQQRISIWYSAPSILTMLTQYGKLDRWDHSQLRIVLFAGEVFPIRFLRALKQVWTEPRFFNLYGPTETNVCTAFEIPAEVSPGRVEAFPIGVSCSHVQVRVVADETTEVVADGGQGELQVRGAAVTCGYWNLPERTSQAFTSDGWYRTGDIVHADGDGQLVFVGRRDRMVKRRGYRVELGEIEAALYRHPELRDVAVVAVVSHETGARIVAYLVSDTQPLPSVINLRVFCSTAIPAYMIPDAFEYIDALPMTSTDKVDYQALIKRVSRDR